MSNAARIAVLAVAGLMAGHAFAQTKPAVAPKRVVPAQVEGAAMLAAPIHAFMAAGLWRDRPGENLLDSGAPFYDTYETADAGHVALGCLDTEYLHAAWVRMGD